MVTASVLHVLNDAFKLTESVLWISGVIGLIYLVRCFKKASLLHYNLKTILINYSIAIAVIGCGRLIMNADSFALSYGTGLPNPSCRVGFLLGKITFLAALLVGISCFFFFTIERTVATFIPKKYEQLKKTGKGAAFFIIYWLTCICASSALGLTFYMNSSHCDLQALANSALFLHANRDFLLCLATLGSFGNAVNVTLLFSLYKLNQKRRKKVAPCSINTRYQYTENILTMRFLIVVSVLNFFSASVVVILLIVHRYARNHELQKDEDIVFTEQYIQVIPAFYVNCYSFVCMRMHRPNKDQFLRDLRKIPCFRSIAPVPVPRVKAIDGTVLPSTNEGSLYFTYLALQWKVKAELE
uniref:G_PROTEIN_RECEP_F1_2 domain-containing protein n=1 Tax=Steinernema glaseri TaxID=37863 RepID=A0A1I8ADH0_9BILA